MTKRTIGVATLAAWAVAAQASLTWTTAVDTNSTTTNQLRSVALAKEAGNQSVYLGYIQTSPRRDVNRHSTNAPYGLLHSRDGAGVSGDQPKAIATDDRGFVYVLNRQSGTNAAVLNIHNADLTNFASVALAGSEFGGAWVRRVGATYQLYVSRESGGTINRYDITTSGTAVLDSTFGTSGTFTVAGAGVLRDIEVADDGTIFVAQRDTGALFRVSSDLSTVTNVAVNRAMGVGLHAGRVYVSNYAGVNSKISVFNQSDLSFVEDITISTLDGNPYSRGSSEGFSFLDIGADGRIWMADQAYGSGKDRLLVSSPVPEPATMTVLALGALAALRKKRLAKKS